MSCVSRCLWLLILVLTACNLSSTLPPPPTQTPTQPFQIPTSTVFRSPTSTPPPTNTPLPTSTSRPPATPVYTVNQPGVPPVCGLAPNVSGANIRSGPGTNTTILGVLPAGHWLRAIRVEPNGWYQVSFFGTPVDGGWLSSTVAVLQQPCVCTLNTCAPVVTPPPTWTPVQPTPTWTPPPEWCAMSVLTLNDAVQGYYQPNNVANWTTLSYGSYWNVLGRTNDGWYAVDGGNLQAPNVGIYRLRWVRTDARITLSGAACGTLKVIDINIPPSSGECRVEPVNVSSVSVYNQSGFDAGISGTLAQGSSLQVAGKTPANYNGAPNGWYAVEALPFNQWEVGKYRLRWIPIDNTVQLTGNCDNLPMVTLDY